MDGELRPIPVELPDIQGWKEVPLHASDEPLVPLGMFSEYFKLETSSIYAGEHQNSPYGDVRLHGALMTVFVRKWVAEALLEAQASLPQDHYLSVLDGYRPLKVQQSLYDHYLDQLRAQHPDWHEDELSLETQRYVSIPSSDSTKPSPHNTGGSVDVTILKLPQSDSEMLQTIDSRLDQLSRVVPLYPSPDQEANDPLCQERYILQMKRSYIMRQKGVMLDFGTPFDHGGKEAALTYYEMKPQQPALSEQLARTNRRMLYNVMIDAGMRPYLEEWWHYNAPKSQMGAKLMGSAFAEYGATTLSVNNIWHEQMRRDHYNGLRRMHQDNPRHVWGRDISAKLIRLNLKALKAVGDPEASIVEKAAVIAP